MADKVRLFVEKLAERTEEGKVNWERTLDEHTYQVAFPDYTVHVSSRPNPNPLEPDDFAVEIKDEDGLVIEEVTASLLRTGPRDNIFDRLETLFRSARRKALGVDKAVNSLLEALGPDPPRPEITDDDVPF